MLFQNINLVLSIFNKKTVTFNQTPASTWTRETNVRLGPGTNELCLEDVLMAAVVNAGMKGIFQHPPLG